MVVRKFLLQRVWDIYITHIFSWVTMYVIKLQIFIHILSELLLGIQVKMSTASSHVDVDIQARHPHHKLASNIQLYHGKTKVQNKKIDM